ncbi:MAG: hypothetical protein WB780_05805 [Candidatus Acidiferrales bacterium]
MTPRAELQDPAWARMPVPRGQVVEVRFALAAVASLPDLVVARAAGSPAVPAVPLAKGQFPAQRLGQQEKARIPWLLPVAADSASHA